MRDSAGKKRFTISKIMLCMMFLSLLFLPACVRAEAKQSVAAKRTDSFLVQVFAKKALEGPVAATDLAPAPRVSRLAGLLYQHPLKFVLIMGGALVLVVVVLLILFRNRARSAAAMEKMLYTDALTGLPNYKAFTRDGRRIIEHHPEKYAVVYMDMHQFKAINDTFGYAAGDRLLISLSSLLQEFVDKGELFARVYADKFVLLLHFSDQEAFAERLDKLSKRLESLSTGEFELVNFLFSAGVFRLQAGDTDLGVASDRANYAKDTVRGHFVNTFVFYDDVMRRQVLSEKALESSMQSALEKGEFEPFYQPKINVVTGDLVGAEALVRWRHPEEGLLPPSSFVPFYEKNGFIVKIDFAMFEAACKQLRDWSRRGIAVVPISVNFSRKHMLDKQFADKLREIANRYEVAPQLLEVEITETIELESMDTAVEFAQSLKANGFTVSIDDYGTGYSSIAFLQKLPFDVLKLDKVFLGNAMETQKARDIMRHVITAVKANGIRVLCEGIETAAQRDFVLDLNCQFAQGYLYSKPLPAEEFEQYLLRAKIAEHSAVDYVSFSNFRKHIWSSSSDFLSRVMPGWIMGCYTTPGYPIFYISPHLLASLGYSEAEFFSETQGLFSNCVHPDDSEEVARQMQENGDHTEEYLLQYRLLKKDGGSIWIRDIGKKVTAENGRDAILCVCTDISDIMALQQEKSDLLSAIPGGVSELLLLPEGPVILSATDLFYEIIGHSAEQMQSLGNSLFAIVYEPDLPEAKASLRRAGAGGSACECTLRIRYSDGSLHWLTLRGTMRSTGRGTVATVIATNIDEQVKNRENARIVRTKMELALTLTEHAVFEYDLKTKTIYEQSGLEQYGIMSPSLSEVPESVISEGYVHPQDAPAMREMYQKIHAGQTYASCEMRLRSARNAEEYIWTRTILSTIYGEDGEPVKAVGIVDNIDHEKQMEHTVVQEEQYRKALMASSILAYDINLNTNRVDRVTGASSERLKQIQNKLPDPHCYTELIGSAVMSMLVEEDIERFLREMEPTALLKLFWGGAREKEYEYRRRMVDGKALWVSAFLHMVQDELSGDILCYVYYRDIQARKDAEESLKYHATRDPLTGLLNRSSGERHIQEFLAAQSDNGDVCHAFLMFDVDHFKKVNDTYGHQQGDEFLIRVGEVIRENLRESDIVVRIGGDEFVALVKNLPDEETAYSIAEKICAAVQESEKLKHRDLTAAVSIGIAIAPAHGQSFQSLYHCADQAMYVAKNSEDIRVSMFDPSRKESHGAAKY